MLRIKYPFKKALLFLGLSIISIILHNAISGLFGVEEPVFFILTLIFWLLCILMFVIGVYARVRKHF